jgi:hypothetical protein
MYTYPEGSNMQSAASVAQFHLIMEDVTGLSVKALRDLITSAGLSYADCLEKPELRARAVEARIALASRDPTPPTTSGDPASGGPAQSSKDATSGKATKGATIEKKLTLSGYPCVVKGPAECIEGKRQPALAIIILHGFGATSADFASIPAAATKLVQSKDVVWVFPQAPIGDIGATAWWSLDPMKWMSAAMTVCCVGVGWCRFDSGTASTLRPTKQWGSPSLLLSFQCDFT